MRQRKRLNARILDLAGPEASSHSEAAGYLSQLTGTAYRHVDCPSAVCHGEMQQKRAPE